MSIIRPVVPHGAWITFSGRYGRVGGPVEWQADRATAPRFAEFSGAWPIIAVCLVRNRRSTKRQTSLQARNRSWHAHVPCRRLGIPHHFRIRADESRGCSREMDEALVFDFTGMALPLADDFDLERRLIILLEEIDVFQKAHPEVLDRLGIDVRISFRDESA
jgi:hypothetical protein